MQAHFCTNMLERSHLEVRGTHPHLNRTKWVFNRLLTR